MTIEQFWQIIETAHKKTGGDPWEQGAMIGVLLEEFSEDDILSFDHHLQYALQRAFTFDLMVASFIVMSFTSEDAFEDFRGWLVMQGRQRFDTALKWPDSIAQFLTRSGVGRISCDSLMMAPATAYEKVTGKDDFYDRVEELPIPTVEQPWPDTRARFRRRFPDLYDHFWDQEKVMRLNKQMGEQGLEISEEE